LSVNDARSTSASRRLPGTAEEVGRSSRCRKIGEVCAAAEDQRALDHILSFALPGQLCRRSTAITSDTVITPADLRSVLVQRADKVQVVGPPRAGGRHLDDVDAVRWIFAKPPFRHSRRSGALPRRAPSVGTGGSTERLDLLLLQHTQELALRGGAISPISSRNTVPPGKLKQPHLVVTASSERTAPVTEELAFEECLEIAEQFTARKAGGSRLRVQRSSETFPSRFPTSRTGVSLNAARSMSCITARIARDSARIPVKLLRKHDGIEAH
jgi:hypothetical protein